METVEIKIETCPDNNFSHQRPHRVRKASFDHGRHANVADLNGNYGHRMLNRRRGSCETSGFLSSLPVRKNSVANLESIPDLPEWQKSLVKQIENLVVNANHGESIKTEIENELGIIKEGIVPQDIPTQRARTRRKSVMHTGNYLHPNHHTSYKNISHTLPQTISNQGQTPNANNGRRKSYANIEHHISRTRRSGSVGNLKETLPPRGRRSSVCHHGTFQIPPIRQRRKSTAKIPTFTVSKITNSQRKSYWIYRRRRRKELRHVEQIIAPKITINSDENTNENKTDSEEPNDIDENNDNSDKSLETLTDSVDGDIDDKKENETAAENTLDKQNDNANSDLPVDEPIPIVRRKCSIQMRYFEISRKRRKDRKKLGSVNTDVDNTNMGLETPNENERIAD